MINKPKTYKEGYKILKRYANLEDIRNRTTYKNVPILFYFILFFETASGERNQDEKRRKWFLQ